MTTIIKGFVYNLMYTLKGTRIGRWAYIDTMAGNRAINWAVRKTSSAPPMTDRRIEIDPAWLVPGPVKFDLGGHKRNLEEG